MALEPFNVKRTAHLACIEISEGKAAQTLTQFDQSFSLAGQMRVADTTGIEPMAHPIEQVQVQAQRLRDDIVTEADRCTDHQQCVPATEVDLYLVSKMIE